MKRLLLSCLLVTVQSAFAETIDLVVYDPCTGDFACEVTGAPDGASPLYHGGGTVNGNAYSGDTVGDVGNFDVISLEFKASSGVGLMISIVTRFVPDATNYPNIKYGDLLLSTTGWHPTGSAPYDGDSASTSGTNWNFAIETCTVTGTADCGIYNISGLTGAGLLKTTDVTQDVLYRTDQHVQTDKTSPTGNTATVEIDNAYMIPDAVDGTTYVPGSLLTYSIPLAALGLSEMPAHLAARWTMTCANDIVEAIFDVPEPSSLSLLTGGLVAWRLQRKMKVSGNADASRRR